MNFPLIMLALAIETRTSYLSVALFTFISFLTGLCCIGGLQMFVERAFKDKEEDKKNLSVSPDLSSDARVD